MKNQACEFLHQPVLVDRGDIPALEGLTWWVGAHGEEIVGDLGVQALQVALLWGEAHGVGAHSHSLGVFLPEGSHHRIVEFITFPTDCAQQPAWVMGLLYLKFSCSLSKFQNKGLVKASSKLA